jgi:membrane-associated phospholipid phosphatase
MQKFITYQLQRIGTWLLQWPLVLKGKKRFPALFRFIAGRFSARDFSGLPLTLLVMVFLFNLLLLSQLVESVVESEGIVTLDKMVTKMLFEARSGHLSLVFYWISQLGTREATFVVGGIFTVLFLFKRDFIPILTFWLVMAGVGLSVRYGKTFINRDRPVDVAYYVEYNLSFPSGHATTAMALFGLCAYFALSQPLSRSGRRLILGSTATLIAAIGFSRIYLGVHFLSDVLAGFLLGALWLLLGISVMELLVHRRQQRKPVRP